MLWEEAVFIEVWIDDVRNEATVREGERMGILTNC
jgi:hypothetical protein